MPASATYTPIATTTLGSAQSTLTFSSIGGYTDLVLITSIKHTGSGSGYWVQALPNADTSASYGNTYLMGDGSSASSSRYSNRSDGYFIGLSDSSGFSIIKTNFMNYANSTTYKTAISRSDSATYQTMALVHLWAKTDAITSIKLQIEGGSVQIATGSTFTLYGIAAA